VALGRTQVHHGHVLGIHNYDHRWIRRHFRTHHRRESLVSDGDNVHIVRKGICCKNIRLVEDETNCMLFYHSMEDWWDISDLFGNVSFRAGALPRWSVAASSFHFALGAWLALLGGWMPRGTLAQKRLVGGLVCVSVLQSSGQWAHFTIPISCAWLFSLRTLIQTDRILTVNFHY